MMRRQRRWRDRECRDIVDEGTEQVRGICDEGVGVERVDRCTVDDERIRGGETNR